MPKKPGRPKTHRKPILVRFDPIAIKKIDARKKEFKLRTRPEAIRNMVHLFNG